MSTADEIITLEKNALRRWCDGDPSGYLELYASDIVYFDPFLERRMDGLDAITRYYEAIRGQAKAERFELINPQVQVVGDAAVLTFNYVSVESSGAENRWNCTEAYRKRANKWEIIQSHWSLTKPNNANIV
jgi:uncharacterized protein (TIGR02246 family)